jgi:tetratricopeptide (TPR) repeat protein
MKTGFYLLCSLVLLFAACSTEKNAFLNRTYHSATARYNGYFNANELLDQALNSFYNSKKDDFYDVLPVNRLPNEEEAKSMYPAIDTAIVKCSEVIKNHSMPSTEDMYYKDVEHNRWIDENWITIGRALYFKRQYEQASRNFKFVKRLFAKDPSYYVAKLWLAKINIEQRAYADAKLTLDDLNAISKDQREKTFRDFIPFAKKKTF